MGQGASGAAPAARLQPRPEILWFAMDMRPTRIARLLVTAAPPLRRWWRKRRLTVAAFEQFYAKEHDPFGFDRSPYEAGKFAHLLKALDGRAYRRALEI